MKRKIFFCTAFLMIIALSASVTLAAEVCQGKCVKFDKENHLVTVEEYDLQFDKENPYGRSTGVQSTYNVKSAEIGIPPAEGDIIRIAYDVKGTERVALKVMNVSKQDLRKK